MPLLCDSCKLENSNFPDFEQNRTEHHKLQFKFPYEITGIAKIIMFLKMRPLQVTKKIDKNHATYILPATRKKYLNKRSISISSLIKNKLALLTSQI